MSYSYGQDLAECTYKAGPHAVSSYDGITYCYDINGNNISSSNASGSSGRSITYTPYNKPARIEKFDVGDSQASEFFYGPNRSRYRRVETLNDQVIEEAFYIGNTEIIDKDNGGSREYRRNIGGIAIEHFYLQLDGTTDEQTDYVLKDNLGSPHTLLDKDGVVTYRVAFDVHGSRTEADNPENLILGINPVDDVTDRGFTGHEHLDGVGVIHMNGRVYDPALGRFLQADPLIQDLGNPQSLNRYTYVFNNPLAYTDPTGYSAFSKYLRPILAIGAAYFTAGWSSSLYAAGNTAGALAVSVGGGALAGAIATGSGKGALIGAFTGAAAFGVESSIAGGGSDEITNNVMRHGAEMLVGGFQNLVNHGEFEFNAATAIAFTGSWGEIASATGGSSDSNGIDELVTPLKGVTYTNRRGENTVAYYSNPDSLAMTHSALGALRAAAGREFNEYDILATAIIPGGYFPVSPGTYSQGTVSLEGTPGQRLAHKAGAIALFVRLPKSADNSPVSRGSAEFIRRAIYISKRNQNLPVAIFAPRGGGRSYLMIEHRSTDSLGNTAVHVTEERF